MTAKKVRRKVINLSIEKEMQRRLILRIFLLALLCICLAGVGFYIYSSQELGNAFWQAHIQVKNVREMLFPAVLLIIALVILVALSLSVFFPLHIAGPKHRIRLSIRRIAQGDLTVHLRFRRRDELHDLADELNRMVIEFNSKISSFQKQGASIVSQVEGMARSAKGRDREKRLQESLTALLNSSQKLQEDLRRFRTEPIP